MTCFDLFMSCICLKRIKKIIFHAFNSGVGTCAFKIK